MSTTTGATNEELEEVFRLFKTSDEILRKIAAAPSLGFSHPQFAKYFHISDEIRAKIITHLKEVDHVLETHS